MSNEINKSEIITVQDFLVWASNLFEAQQLFFGHGTDNAWDEAVLLVLFVFQLPADVDRSILTKILEPHDKQVLIELASRRAFERIPLPYLTNEAWFAGERYYIDEGVIIPRSPLAELIADHFQPWIGATQPQRILDLCTGSGCLAIYVAKQFPNAAIDAVDISDLALNIARRNLSLHKCENRVNLIKSDLFAALPDTKYDIIISNPPYVATEEMQELPEEYLHEPELALHSGIDGLDITRRILRESLDYLTEDGLLVVEVGNSWVTLDRTMAHLPFTWLEFANGGDGVFLLTARELRQYGCE